MPAVIKILAVFGGVLALTRLRVHLGAALVIGGVVLNIWAGLPVEMILVNFAKALKNPELWIFVAIVALIVEIGRHLTEKENADAVLGAVRRWGGRRGKVMTIMALPAVIGLIPMPAGALVSAPFVRQAGGDGENFSEWKAAVNYWFRHVWEYWWPLYPGVIVALSIFEMDFRKFFAAEFFYSFVALAAGYIWLVRAHVRRLTSSVPSEGGSAAAAWLVLLPVVVVVACLFVLPRPFEAAIPCVEKKIRDMLVLLAGLVLGVAYVVVYEIVMAKRAGEGGARRIRLFATQLNKTSINTQISLFGVLVFKVVLSESGLLPTAARELATSGLPPSLAVALLPILAGFVTGIALGFSGTSFPMVVGIMHTANSNLTPMATLVLAYGWGYIGMMLSPVHLCLLTTRDYFGCSGVEMIRMIWKPLAAVAAWSIAAHLMFRAFGL